MHDRLYRSRDDVVIGGVAGGVAKALDMDPSIVRVVWVVLAFVTGGVAALVYLIMLIVVPQEPLGAEPLGFAAPPPDGGAGAESASPGTSSGTEPAAATPAAPIPSSGRRRRAERDSGGALVFGVILILVGAYFLIREYVPDIDVDVIWPAAIIVVGLLLLVGALRPGRRSGA